MSKEEINGFLVDKFNQHGLKENAAQGVCPLCSHTRKPKNAKAQCASYDWERGLAAYGHMGKTPRKITKVFESPYNGKVEKEVTLFTWEQLDKVSEVQKAFDL